MTQTYKVQVSMNQASIVQTDLVLKQGDFGFQIAIEILDFDLTGVTPQIVFRKAAGAVESTTLSLSGTTYTYTMVGTELDTPGLCLCDIKLKNSTTQRISTASFSFMVEPDTLNGLNEQVSSYSDTIAQIADGLTTEIDNFTSSVNDLFKEQYENIFLTDTQFEGTKGYYQVSNGQWVDNNNVSNTGLIFIKGYDYLSAIGRLNNQGYAIAFFDINKNLMTDISVINPADSATAIELLNIDLSSETYQNAYYVMVAAYGTDNIGKLSLLKVREYVNTSKTYDSGFDGTPGYYKVADGTWRSENSVKNTGLILIKGFETMSATGYLNQEGYCIAFFDSLKRLMSSISVHTDTGGPSSTSLLDIDLTSVIYQNAYYIMVCAFTNSNNTGTLVLEQSNNTNAISKLNSELDATNNEIDNLTSSIQNVLNEQYPNVYLTDTQFTGAKGFYRVSDGTFINNNNVSNTGMIFIKGYDYLSAIGRLNNQGYAIAFFDINKNLMTDISVINPADSATAIELLNIDLSSETYQNAYYVMVAAYGTDNIGKLSLLKVNDNLEKKLTFDFGFDGTPGYYKVADGTFTSVSTVKNTGLVLIKGYESLSAQGYLNEQGYCIAFFDAFMRLLTSISEHTSTGGASSLDLTNVDLTSSAYKVAYYCMVCAYNNQPGNIGKLDLKQSNDFSILSAEVNNIKANLHEWSNKTTARIFKKIVCVGDSYTTGWHKVAGDETYSDHPEYAWPHYISDITGNDWINCGVSGATTLSWVTNPNGYPKAQQLGVSQAYVVGLMINDINQSLPLGTIGDIYDDEPTTYYGGLARLIRLLAEISPQAHIFVNTCPKVSDSYTLFNQAVRDVVAAYSETYKVHCIDLSANADFYSNDSFIGDAINGHYTAIGYEQMAEIYCYLLSDYINKHISTFQDVYKIPYDA